MIFNAVKQNAKSAAQYHLYRGHCADISLFKIKSVTVFTNNHRNIKIVRDSFIVAPLLILFRIAATQNNNASTESKISQLRKINAGKKDRRASGIQE